MKRTSLLAGTVAAAIAMALTLTGCGSDAESADGKVTITISEYGEGTKSLVDAAGVFDDADYEVKFAHFDSGPAMLAALVSNNLDLAYVGGLPPVVAASSGLKFKVVASVTPLHPEIGGHNLLVKKGSDVKEISDLDGATIGVPKGTSAHSFAMTLLDENGLTPDDVEFAYLEPTQLAPALSSGRIDAAAIWEPIASAVRRTGATVLSTDEGPAFPKASFMAASDATLGDKSKRATVTDAIERIADAYAWAADHEQEHAEAISKDSGVSVKDALAEIKGSQLQFGPITDQITAANQKTADLFFEVGEIPAEVDFASVVDNVLD
jgi:sulfonate transport system substrate-binding protein